MEQLREDLAVASKQAAAYIAQKVNRSVLNHDRNVRGCNFKPGDRAWLFNPAAKKLKLNWRGLFVVVEKLHETNAILRSDKPNSKRFVTHLSKLKRSYGEALPSYVEWAEERPNRSAELQSKGP